MLTHHHIIERARIEVSSLTGNHALQKGVANWWEATAVPAIEEVLEELLPAGAHLRLDRLDLDLGHFKRLDPDLPGDRNALTERLKETLRDQLKELLADAQTCALLADTTPEEWRSGQGNGKTASSPQGQRFAAWLYYLEYGHRPWWSAAFPAAAEWADFIAKTLSEPAQRATVANLIRRSRAAALRLAADARHTAAFRALLERNERLKAARKSWLAAAPAYAGLASRLPVSAPPATEWTTAGSVVCWWFLLTETTFESEVAALKALLTQAIPGIRHWPEERADDVLAMLELPTVNSGGSSFKNRSSSDERDSVISEDQTLPGEKDEAGDVAKKDAEKALSSPDDVTGNTLEGRDLADRPAAPSGNERIGEERTPGEPKLPPVSRKRKPSSVTAKGYADGVNPATGSGAIDGLKGDVPGTVAWSDAGTKTPIAPAAAPPNDADTWYVDHAGVVLAHPFLAPLFTALGYWSDGAFADTTAQQRAVYLTHYLATGAAESHEEDLPLCKLLCGWPVSGAPARLTVPLTDTDRHEADEVLRSLVEHWKAIGAASPEGLREGFFAREGRLREGENGWQVTVDRRAQDILLGRLPWGISLVQAPWHDSFIKVEW